MNTEENKSVIAHLFLKGKPLVLNYQLMESRLKRPRLTPSQRSEYSRQLKDEAGFLTVADNEKAEPLLIHFRSENDRYTLRVATPGKFYGYYLSMEKMLGAYGEELEDRNLVVLEKANPTRFYLDNVSPGVVRLMNVDRKYIFSSDLSGDDFLTGSIIGAVELAHNKILGPTYRYSNPGHLANDPQQYFSDVRKYQEHVIFDPIPVVLTIQIKGAGILELSDIG
ncbi:hypothetical protein ACYZT8_15405 [Pseudomonas sp. LB3P93]|jgi:hypothetical protein